MKGKYKFGKYKFRKHKMGIRVRDYELLSILGKGSFGVTYLSKDLLTGEEVAIKTINVRKSVEKGVDKNLIYEEIDTLKFLTGAESVKYVASYYDNFEDILEGEETIFIISEYIDGRSLGKFISENPRGIPHNILWPLFMQLVLGLKYIHGKGYAHRDIKPDNILITKDNVIKYIDFGLACLNECKRNNCQNKCMMGSGTIDYHPPEFYNGAGENSFLESKAHDIWSLGVVMFNMTNGKNKYPFETEYQGYILSDKELIENIIYAPYIATNYFLDDGRTNQFVDSLLINNWKERPQIGEILNNLVNNIFAVPW